MLDVPTRSEALLDLLLKNRQNLFCDILSDSLGGSDHNIVVFGIWLGMLKAVLRQKLEFRRAHFQLRAQLGGIHEG